MVSFKEIFLWCSFTKPAFIIRFERQGQCSFHLGFSSGSTVTYLLSPMMYSQPRPSNVTSGCVLFNQLTHWGRVTHICASKVTIIVSNNGLSPGRRQAIIWNNAGILLIGPLGTNFSGILIEIHTFSFMKMHLKMSSGKWRPFCLGLNVF